MQVFFIVGAQKSGSSWLQKSLNSIEGIHCLGEGHFIDKLLMPMAQSLHEYNKMMQVVEQRVYEGKGFYGPVPDQEFMMTMRNWILSMMVRNAKVPQNSILAIGDKTPANSFHIPTLKKLFPRCRFIHLLRDGRDVAVSAYRHRNRIQAETGQTGTSLDDAAPQLLATWAGCTRAIRKAEMAGIPIHTMRYEAMLDNSAASLRGCVNHLLPQNSISDQQILAAIDANSFQVLSGGRAAGTINENSNLRRGQAGSWKDEFSPAVAEQFNPEDRELLESLGYTA
uniref:sulfotransferase family protein n=1 Tax=Synechococcus sp. UW106 TaxID=368495 RepID=UPI001A7E0DC2|nr:sulfotransferase [Synechococcus sp. UW106]